MKINTAYYCQICLEIFEFPRHGTCPLCQSRTMLALDWLRRSAAERKAWLEQIRGAPSRGIALLKAQAALRR